MMILCFWLSIESRKPPFILLAFIQNSIIRFGEKVPNEKSTSFFQKITIPPPLLISRQTSIIPPNFILLRISSSLTLSSHVSAKNTTKGSYAWIKSLSSCFVRRFPSPQQFQDRRFIAPGGLTINLRHW